MILIADGGSTKCDWVALNQSREVVFKTQTLGLNPTVLSTQKIHQRIVENEKITHIKEKVSAVYFYGAGCGTSRSQAKLVRFFKNYFTGSCCEVKGDLYAACYAVTRQPGIVCILGTGSNSCYFDGEELKSNAPALGYAIMDEASGNYFGKKLIRDYFYEAMPQNIACAFETEYDLDPAHIRHNLYQKEHPNSYLADFAQFIFKKDPLPPYFQKLLKEGLQNFIKYRVLSYPESQEVPIHFVGSIAHYSQAIIDDLLRESGLIEGTIIQRPIDGLIKKFQEDNLV